MKNDISMVNLWLGDDLLHPIIKSSCFSKAFLEIILQGTC